MALNRINGREELYVGGVFALRRASLIREHKITHILSVIKYSLEEIKDMGDVYQGIQHMSVDVDDMEDEDILAHLPKMVRFIERGLYGTIDGGSSSGGDADEITPATESSSAPGAVLVHCAMGKSRSVSAVVAYLLWKHPHRFGRADPTTSAYDAVMKAVTWVRQTRPIAEPNEGFMKQLELWWEMGSPALSDDAVEKDVKYQRWLYKREVDDAARVGRAPDWIRFEDEEDNSEAQGGRELRCKKCRRVLVNEKFIVPHQGRGNKERADCGHVFVEALSWMKSTLEAGELDGRLVCPNEKCGASIGRYAWQGFKCSCGDWIAPAFSLQKSKVDEVVTKPKGVGTGLGAMAAMGIRMPPSAGRQGNL